MGNVNKYQYFKLSPRRYFCIQQNVLELAWVLFVKKETLRPLPRNNSTNTLLCIKTWFTCKFKYYRYNLKVLARLMLFKANLMEYGSVLELPFYGQLCMLVHKGYKIFDLKRGKVIKLFDNNVSTSIVSSEIELMKRVSSIEFATAINRWDVEEGWYEENFIAGSLEAGKPLEANLFIKNFFRHVAPCIERLLFFQPPLAKNLLEYANELTENLSTLELLINDLDSLETDKTMNFIYSIINRLRSEKNCDIYLVFSHGDFCPENMLKANRGLRIFDWEGAKHRSALFDFYSFLFYGPSMWNILPKTLEVEIGELLPFIFSKITIKAPRLVENLQRFKDVYRLVYYVERISMLLERKETDNNLEIGKYILQYIDAYNQYEELGNSKRIACG